MLQPFYLNLATGLIQPARLVPTEHCDERQDSRDISLLVIHNISLPPKQFGGPYIDQLFTGRLNSGDHPYFEDIAALRVSSHLLIRRNGDVVQYVPFHKRAWHAGVSSFEGRDKCNDYSIGIELEGADDIPYEKIQYQTLANITQVILKAYPQITPARIVGHSDIASGRKTDPGPAFEWDNFRKLIEA